MKRVLKFTTLPVPRKDGEQARLRVVTGPDQGSTFVLTGGKATIGRADENDVALSDLRASREHAVVEKLKLGWRVRDLGSANGIFHNGQPTREARLRSGHTFAVGDTLFEFLMSEESTQMLLSSPAASVERRELESQHERVAHDARVRALTSFGGGAPLKIPSVGGAAQRSALVKRLPLIGLCIVAVAVLLFMPDDHSAPTKTPVKAVTGMDGDLGRDVSREIAAMVPNPEIQDKAENFFRTSFREFREGNYLRAKTGFETVLQIYPQHSLARIYLKHSENKIGEEVKFHLDRGRKSASAGRSKEARMHFEAVLRLLYRQPSHPDLIEARDHLSKLDTKKRGRS